MRKLLVLVLLSVALHIFLLVVIPDDGSLAESIYARHVYPVLGSAFAWLPSLLPFSVATVAIAALALLVPASLLATAWQFRHGPKAAVRALGRTVAIWIIVSALIFHTGYLLWGYNYLRPPLEQRLDLVIADLSEEELAATTRIVLQRAVDAIVEVPDWDPRELDELIDQAMSRALMDLEGRPPPVVSPLKSDLGTGALAISGVAGVFAPWTLEPHVDYQMPAVFLPFTAAHEKAHQAGFARERDANFIAWYALAGSDDPRLQFAAYLRVSLYFSSPETAELKELLRPFYLSRLAYHSSRTSERVAGPRRVVNDGYLRANRMPSGTGDYARVSDLIRAWLLQRE